MGKFTWNVPNTKKLEWDMVNATPTQVTMAGVAERGGLIARGLASGHGSLGTRVRVESEVVTRGEYPVKDWLVSISDKNIMSIEYGRKRTRGMYRSEKDVAGLRILHRTYSALGG